MLSAFIVAAFLESTLWSQSAFAATPGCGYTNHCYADLQAGDSTTTIYDGMYGTWNRAAMSSGCTSSIHQIMNSEMWFSQRASTHHGWIEVGHTSGWLAAKGACDYYAFAAWQYEDGSGYGEAWLATLDHNDGVTDEFQISRSGTVNKFYAYFNGTRVLTPNVQFWDARGFALGGEIITPLATSHTFSMTARAIDGSGTRVLLPAPQVKDVRGTNLTGTRTSNSSWTWRVNP